MEPCWVPSDAWLVAQQLPQANGSCRAVDLDPRLASSVPFAAFCELRSGSDAEDYVVCTLGTLREFQLYFGLDLDRALQHWGLLCEASWFVVEPWLRLVLRQESQASFRSYAYGGLEEVFGICLAESAPDFAVIEGDTKTGTVRQKPIKWRSDASYQLDGWAFPDLAAVARMHYTALRYSTRAGPCRWNLLLQMDLLRRARRCTSTALVVLGLRRFRKTHLLSVQHESAVRVLARLIHETRRDQRWILAGRGKCEQPPVTPPRQSIIVSLMARDRSLSCCDRVHCWLELAQLATIACGVAQSRPTLLLVTEQGSLPLPGAGLFGDAWTALCGLGECEIVWELEAEPVLRSHSAFWLRWPLHAVGALERHRTLPVPLALSAMARVAELPDRRLAQDLCFATFCEVRCGNDAAGHVLVIGEVMRAFHDYFGASVDTALERLRTLCDASWFVDESQFHQRVALEVAIFDPRHYYAFTTYYGLCFDLEAPHYVLLQYTEGRGDNVTLRTRVDIVERDLAFRTLNEVAHRTQAENGYVWPLCLWSRHASSLNDARVKRNCTKAIVTLLGLKRFRSSMLSSNHKDMLILIGQLVRRTRWDERWSPFRLHQKTARPACVSIERLAWGRQEVEVLSSEHGFLAYSSAESWLELKQLASEASGIQLAHVGLVLLLGDRRLASSLKLLRVPSDCSGLRWPPLDLSVITVVAHSVFGGWSTWKWGPLQPWANLHHVAAMPALLSDQDPCLARDELFASYCEMRCGLDKQDNVCVSLQALRDFQAYFGAEMDDALAEFHSFANAQWFVHEDSFRAKVKTLTMLTFVFLGLLSCSFHCCHSFRPPPPPPVSTTSPTHLTPRLSSCGFSSVFCLSTEAMGSAHRLRLRTRSGAHPPRRSTWIPTPRSVCALARFAVRACVCACAVFFCSFLFFSFSALPVLSSF
jgi:hypothetical protein